MSEYHPSAALLRTRIVSRAACPEDRHFESGHGTRPATRAFERQASGAFADRVLRATRRLRPRTEERTQEIQRRRKWAGGGNMPADVRMAYSEAERAALAVIADQCRKRGYCDLCLDAIARLAGVGRTSVQNAIRKARSKELGHIAVRERPQQASKSLTNIIRIVSKSWCNWIARAIGFKRLNTSETQVKISPLKGADSLEMALERENAGRSEADLLKPSTGGKSFQPSEQAHYYAHSFQHQRGVGETHFANRLHADGLTVSGRGYRR